MFVLKEGGESRHPHPPGPLSLRCSQSLAARRGGEQGRKFEPTQKPRRRAFCGLFFAVCSVDVRVLYPPAPSPRWLRSRSRTTALLLVAVLLSVVAEKWRRHGEEKSASSSILRILLPLASATAGRGGRGVRVTRDLPLSYSPVGWALQRMRPSVSHRGLPLHVSITHPAEFGSPRTKRATEMTE